MVIVSERLVGAESLFELREREPGVRGEEGAGCVDGFEDDFAATASAHAEAKNTEKVVRLGGFTGGNLDHFLCAGKLFEFPCLCQVSVDQLQVFRLFEFVVTAGGLVTVGDDVAGEGRENVLRLRLAGKSSHPGKRPKRAGDGDDLAGLGGAGSGRR